jgi:glutamate formiminotransferase/formiminotetrahydrofolate cyclodeaminase
VLERTLEVFAMAKEAAASGNPNSVSDAGVAASAALAAAEGAYYNVLINLKGAEGDADWARATLATARRVMEEARAEGDTLSGLMTATLSPS